MILQKQLCPVVVFCPPHSNTHKHTRQTVMRNSEQDILIYEKQLSWELLFLYAEAIINSCHMLCTDAALKSGSCAAAQGFSESGLLLNDWLVAI